MADHLTNREKELLAKEAADCVRAGGDVGEVIRRWTDGDPARDRLIVAGARYIAQAVGEQIEREAAEKAARDAFLADDIAVVEDLIQRLPKVLERLRAAEAANGR